MCVFPKFVKKNIRGEDSTTAAPSPLEFAALSAVLLGLFGVAESLLLGHLQKKSFSF
jgi:hypothetical protein